MAERQVFVAFDKVPYYRVVNVNFEWNSGFAVSQKQKNIQEIHLRFKEICPTLEVLEISSKSMQENGTKLSAFHLKKDIPGLGHNVPVEQIYQAAKIFEFGGPYTDILSASPKDAKRDERLKNSGKLTGFYFDGKKYPSFPVNAFYDYIYMNALLENEEAARTVLKYDAFTDIEFNPAKSINCQARAAAVFASLSRLGLIDHIRDYDSYMQVVGTPNILYTISENLKTISQKQRSGSQKQGSDSQGRALPKAGQFLIHGTFGTGMINKVGQNIIYVTFPKKGEVKLGLDWCLRNCRILEKNAEEKPEENIEEKTEGNAEEKAEGNVEENIEEKPEGNAEEKPEENAKEKAEENVEEKPEGNAEEKSEEKIESPGEKSGKEYEKSRKR